MAGAREQDIGTLRDDAERAVLREITKALDHPINATAALTLAEAYAWLKNPNQPHGGQGGDR